MYKKPAMAMAGMAASTTKVISQPVIKANINPAIIIESVIIIIDIFSPMAFWKAKVSAENLDAS